MPVAQGAPDGHQPASARVRRRAATRVSTLELLLDLVFVLAASQVARAVAADPTWPGVLRAVLVMAILWWMYDAYIWLTNQAVPDTPPVRLLLVAAMAAFLVVALAIPETVHGNSALFGWAYVAAALIHGGLFIALGGPTSARVMVRVMPVNVAAGVLVALASLLDEPWSWVLLAAPLVLFAVAAGISRRAPFDLAGDHFVERHGLLLIIALGESVVSVGAAVGTHGLDTPSVAGAVLVVAVVAALWWCYFAEDAPRPGAFEGVEPRRRTAVALRVFFVDHLAMLVGLILLGAGLHLGLEDALRRPDTATAWLVAGGVALYLLGEIDHRHTLRLGPSVWRAAASATGVALALARPPVLVLLAALAAVVVLAAFAESRLRRMPARPRTPR
ncbi:low temperature requirement protein A [Cellulomonas soli]